jgi:hypothetical protein
MYIYIYIYICTYWCSYKKIKEPARVGQVKEILLVTAPYIYIYIYIYMHNYIYTHLQYPTLIPKRAHSQDLSQRRRGVHSRGKYFLRQGPANNYLIVYMYVLCVNETEHSRQKYFLRQKPISWYACMHVQLR